MCNKKKLHSSAIQQYFSHETLAYKTDIDNVNMNHYAQYMSQRSLCFKVIARTQRHTERLTYSSDPSIYTVIHNYGNPYEKWNIFVARPYLWLLLGMVKPEIMLCETVLNLSTLNTLTYLLTYLLIS